MRRKIDQAGFILMMILLTLYLSSCSHPTDDSWLNKQSKSFHGKSLLNCDKCHDPNTQCVVCHFDAEGSKSPSDWVHGTTPHSGLLEGAQVCNMCHALDRSFGNGPAACHDCHDLTSLHVMGEPWLNKTSPDFHGGSTLNCAGCHDPEVKCSQCHFGATGSKSGSDWVHGTAPHSELSASEAVCNSCHELSRSYGDGPAACHDCHALPETHVLGETWLNRTSPDFHGGSTLNCASCHDLSTDCSQCHFGASGSKSPSGWVHGTTPHEQLSASEVVCNSCHDMNRSYGKGPTACHDCHALPEAHVLGEAWLSKTSPDFHGGSTLNCASCHDLGTECSQCHFGATGSKSPSDWVHGTTPHSELSASEAVCNSCHELNRSYGNGPAACHDCHALPDAHVLGEAWLNRTSPDFHGGSTLDCVSCHDLATECSQCHFGATGSKSPSSWVHHQGNHKALVASGPVCNSCHTLNRSYGNGPAACHDCHDD